MPYGERISIAKLIRRSAAVKPAGWARLSHRLVGRDAASVSDEAQRVHLQVACVQCGTKRHEQPQSQCNVPPEGGFLWLMSGCTFKAVVAISCMCSSCSPSRVKPRVSRQSAVLALFSLRLFGLLHQDTTRRPQPREQARPRSRPQARNHAEDIKITNRSKRRRTSTNNNRIQSKTTTMSPMTTMMLRHRTCCMVSWCSSSLRCSSNSARRFSTNSWNVPWTLCNA